MNIPKKKGNWEGIRAFFLAAPGGLWDLSSPIRNWSQARQWRGFPQGSMVKNPPVRQEIQIHFWVRNTPWKRKWQPTTIFLPGKFHGQRSLAGFKRVRHELETKQQSSKNTKVHLIPRATLSQGLPYPRSTSSQGPPYPSSDLSFQMSPYLPPWAP